MSPNPHQRGSTRKVAAPYSMSPTGTAKMPTGNTSQMRALLPNRKTIKPNTWAKDATTTVQSPPHAPIVVLL
jgi:hypothetical protein